MKYLQRRLNSLPPGHPTKGVEDAKRRFKDTPARGEILTTLEKDSFSVQVFVNDLVRLRPGVNYEHSYIQGNRRLPLPIYDRIFYARVVDSHTEGQEVYLVCSFGLISAYISLDEISPIDLSGPSPFDEYEWLKQNAIEAGNPRPGS